MTKRAVFLIKPPYLQIADILRREHGWETYGLTTGPIADRFTSGMVDTLDLFSVIGAAKSDPIPDDIVSRCAAIEEEHEVNLADIISVDRHMGRGWATGGLYPRGFLSDLPYERHLYIVYRMFEAIVGFLGKVMPDMVCPGVVGSMQTAVVYSVSKSLNIPVFGLAEGRYRLAYYWQQDQFGTVPGLEEKYRKLKASNGPTEILYADDFATGTGDYLPGLVEKTKLFNLVRELYGIVRHRWKELIVEPGTAGQIYLSARLRHQTRRYLNTRKEMRRQYPTMDELASSRYVYFPLHFEPEASLNGREPHFTNQMYAVELLSRSVPADVKVLVKEHWGGVGNRPANWMDTVARIPRVEIAAPFGDSIELIRRSMAVATITGTAGLEAAVMGKPVISLGPNYRFNFVDHVWFANDLPELRRLIRHIRDDWDSAGVIREGAILRKAYEQSCFQAKRAIAGVAEPSVEDIEVACKELLRLVEESRPAIDDQLHPNLRRSNG